MSKSIDTIRGLFKRRINRRILQRASYILLLLALGIGDVGTTTLVLAAPSAQEIVNLQTTYALVYQLPNGPICAGESYDIPVRVESRSTGLLNGDQVNFQELLYGVTVVAHSNDHSIVEFDPYIGVTGDEELAVPGQDPTEINLILYAKKAGTTSISFDAEKSSIFFNAKFPPRPIKVVNCKYKVTVNSRWDWSLTAYGVRISSNLAAYTNGEMSVNADGTLLNGTANAGWFMSSFAAGCNQSHRIADSQALLQGSQSSDGSQITVHIVFKSVTIASTHCVGGETRQFTPPPIRITLPAEGGTETVDHPFQLGGENLAGTSTIQITPLPTQ